MEKSPETNHSEKNYKNITIPDMEILEKMKNINSSVDTK
jgi:hypothetical protein